MAWTQHKHTLPKQAASAIRDYVPVKETAVAEKVVLAASNIDQVIGFTIASAASPGDSLAVVHGGVVKAVAGASLGYGAEVSVASTNGALGPAPAGASGFDRQAVGVSQGAAAAGEIFSVLIRPRGIGGQV
jgi:hypothetical protein